MKSALIIGGILVFILYAAVILKYLDKWIF